MVRLSFALALALTVLAPNAASARDRHVTLGTLICTTEDVTTPPPAVSRALECRFVPASVGRVVNLTGTLQQFAGEGVPPGSHVMIWSVLAPSLRTSADALQGRYTSAPAKMVPGDGGFLIGGANGDIGLRPVTPDAQTGTEATQTVIDLVLAPIRT